MLYKFFFEWSWIKCIVKYSHSLRLIYHDAKEDWRRYIIHHPPAPLGKYFASAISLNVFKMRGWTTERNIRRISVPL